MADISDRFISDEDPWLSPDQVGEELQVNPATVRLWIRRGRLQATRVGRSWRVRRSEVDRVLRSGASSAYSDTSASPRPAPRRMADHLITVTPPAGRES